MRGLVNLDIASTRTICLLPDLNNLVPRRDSNVIQTPLVEHQPDNLYSSPSRPMPLDADLQERAPGELRDELNEQVGTFRSRRELGG